MKKIILVLTISMMLFSACNSIDTKDKGITREASAKTDGNTDSESATVSQPKISDYFPFEPDIHMKYKGTGNEYAEFETYVDFIKDSTMQVRNINPGTNSVTVYKLENGTLKNVYSQGEVYYSHDYTSLKNRDEIIIKEPIREGTSWTLDDGSVRSITAVDKEIKVPAGNFKTIEVTTKEKDLTIRSYYAENVGLVKTEFKADDNSFNVTSELELIQKDTPYRQTVRFYFPEFLKDRIAYIDRKIDIYTNQDVKLILENELKSVPENSGLSKVLSPNTKILGCSIDDEKGIINVDFSTHLVKEMNAGTGFEYMLLQSIVNTFGDYYGKDKVVITLEGKPYESGHILKETGEYFTVEKDKAVEYKGK